MKKIDFDALLKQLFENEDKMLNMSKEIEKGIRINPKEYKADYKKIIKGGKK